MFPTGSRPQRLAWVAMVLLIAVMAVVRFVGLEKSPPGFHADEAVVATEAIALRQTGYNSHHEHTLFTPMDGGGYASPTHLYPKALWISLAGYSITAMRAYAGLEATLLLAGLFVLARARLGPRAAVFTLLAASISPWIFPLSRMAIDDPLLSLAGLVWGMYFFLRSGELRDALLSAICFSAAAYAYSSARVTLPFLVVLLLWVKRPEHFITFRYLGVFVVTGTALCAPILVDAMRGTLLSRFAQVGILAPAHLHGAGFGTAVGEFLSNLRLHLAPDYLFVSGDANLRHSTQFSGEFSWLDTFALVLGLSLLGSSITHFRRVPINRFIALCVIGFVVAIFPSALTWEGVPHAIRGSGCVIFVALLTGFSLARAEQRWAWALPVGALIAMFFAAGFLRHYFEVYPHEAWEAFQTNRLDAAKHGRDTGNWLPLARLTPNDPPAATRYYLIEYGGRSFEQSGALLQGLAKQPQATTGAHEPKK